jgi:hypothetical protein
MFAEIIANAMQLAPATLLSSGVFLTDQIFAARISQEAILVVSLGFYLPLLGLVFARSIGPAFNIIFNKDKNSHLPDDRERLLANGWFASANTLVAVIAFVYLAGFLALQNIFINTFKLGSTEGVNGFYVLLALSSGMTILNTFMTFALISIKRSKEVLRQNLLVFLVNLVGDALAIFFLKDNGQRLMGLGLSTLVSQIALFALQRLWFFPIKVSFRFANPELFFKRSIHLFGWDLVNGYIGLATPLWISYLVIEWGGTGLAAGLNVGARVDHFLSVIR